MTKFFTNSISWKTNLQSIQIKPMKEARCGVHDLLLVMEYLVSRNSYP